MGETRVVRYMIKANANVVNEVKENGAISRSIEGTVENMSISFDQPDNVHQHILDEFDITLRYKEDVNVERNIALDIKPIRVKVTLQQLLLFQKLADQIAEEVASIEFVPSAPKELSPVKQPETHTESVTINDALDTRLQLTAKLELLNFTLEDDLDIRSYPLIRVWAVHMLANATVDPKKDKHFSAQLFEVAIELGKMLNSGKEKYKGMKLPKPTVTFKGDTEVYQPYKELVYILRKERRWNRGFRINGLESEVNIDEHDNIKADAKLWRLVAKDRQLAPGEGEGAHEFRPLLAPDYQAIIGNPQIEEACAAAEEVADTEEKLRMIKQRLGEKRLSQFHVLVDLKNGADSTIDVCMEEFRVVLAPPTMLAVAKILKHVAAVKDKVMPRMLLALSKKRLKVKRAPGNVKKLTEKVIAPPFAGSKISFRGKLRNIVVLLPETVLRIVTKIGKIGAGTGGTIFADDKRGGRTESTQRGVDPELARCG